MTDYSDLTRDELQRRLKEAEEALAILRDGQADAILGSREPLLVKLHSVQKALEESEERFRGVMDHAADILICHDQGRIVEVNRAACESLGYSREELLGSPIHQIDPLVEGQGRPREIWAQLAPGKTCRLESRLRRKDGTEFPVEVSLSRLDLGGRQLVLGVGRDISERKLIEEELRSQKSELGSILRVAPTGIGLVINRVLVKVNHKLCAMVGFLEEELIGQSARILYPSDAEFELVGKEKYAQIFDHGYGVVETKWKRKDGSMLDIYLCSTPMDETNLERGVIFTALDITARKQTEEALTEATARYRTLVEDSFDGIFIMDSSKLLFVNKRLREMLGYGHGEMEGMDHWKLYHPDSQELTRGRAQARMRGEDVPPRYQVKALCKDGSWFDAEIRAKVILLDGQPGIQCWIRDISERVRAEKILKDSESKFRAAFQSSPIAMSIVDRATNKVMHVNDRYSQIFDRPADKFEGLSSKELSLWADDAARSRFLSELNRQGMVTGFTADFRRGNGALFTAKVSGSPVEVAGIPCWLYALEDISEQRRLEAQLRQAQKMEAVGTLAGGVAHDFNNILSAIIGYSEIAIDDATAGRFNPRDIEQILKAADRAKLLVKQILTFSRKAETNFRPLDLNKEVLRATELLARTIPRMVFIKTDLATDLWKINADPQQMEQVLINLVVNASDAVHGQGTVHITTGNRVVRDQSCLTCGEKVSGPYVVLEISDNGQGMDENTLEHIFEPFFTTKEVGKGTGLGLSTVYGIVLGHRGHIACKSAPAEGTTFTIFLPALDEGAEAAGAEPPPLVDSSPQGKGRILLVDDEEFLLALGSRQLGKAGHEVVTASSGEQALEIFRETGAALDLVILDLSMPGMGGYKALREFLSIDPQVRVIIASGYAADGQIKDSLAAGAAGYVAKPFKGSELLAMVKSVLDNK